MERNPARRPFIHTLTGMAFWLRGKLISLVLLGLICAAECAHSAIRVNIILLLTAIIALFHDSPLYV
jgi:hypothetical protein